MLGLKVVELIEQLLLVLGRGPILKSNKRTQYA